MFHTNGFRFGHRTGGERCEMIMVEETADRCLGCDAFVSVIRLNGAIVSGYSRTCCGPAACYDELYRPPAPAVQEPPAPEPAADNKKEPAPAPEKPKAPEKKTPPPEETGPVFSPFRGEKFREAFFRVAIPEQIDFAAENSPNALRLQLLALALASPAARGVVTAGIGLDKAAGLEALAAKIFEIPPQDIPGELRRASLAHVLDSATAPIVRRTVAEKIGISLARDWRITREYLESLSGSELVRVCEEDNVGIWDDPKVKEYRKDHHKGKALRSLKKPELIDMVMNSGVDLAGRVPAEILGEKKG
jgi:hypothetical protein